MIYIIDEVEYNIHFNINLRNMQITIITTLTDEQALILAKEKWYQELINNIPDTLEIINPQTPWEFLSNIYKDIIAWDISKHFITYNDRQNQNTRDIEDKWIRDGVLNNISFEIL